MERVKYTKEELEIVVKDCKCYRDVLKKFNRYPSGSLQIRIKRDINRFGHILHFVVGQRD